MKAAEARRNICYVYEENAIKESVVRKLFSRFKEHNFGVSDSSRTEDNPTFMKTFLDTLIHNDTCRSTQKYQMY